ncbi:SusC/RagA family TonB-linked outer membrane protein [Sphingobacterium sp. DK4209]|uniref:SusC/RagA family TonB-linked outer membrane protein n=1 Tax=Sphingobacterium zhuxiongii TaxID=2662364 RepID=A0A5Q0QA91_9SPHI|nr:MULTISPECIES: SusC/RagA family TonB-linked outer membrane protein [unclassified Sphingobacterium]MVZ67354.1 SusC/RagA family TonB-linked outer membrane protein [Sphingobacterium sp. DK4209]QGA26194.1 SusC/RagA family TonB-linked outer membrane protein [Sphingobacterium sp. dk4302]
MNKRLLTCVVLSVFAGNYAFGQSKIINGRILDKQNNSPISGVTVRNATQNLSTQTDANGNFSIKANNGDQIETTFIGYAFQFVKWDGKSTLSLALEKNDAQIDEVIVTGYGNTNKKAFTGSASVIDRDKMKDLQSTSISDVLQGNASGVLAIGTTGQPGEDAQIRIRGIGSYNASSAPLILLDGAPYNGSLNSINPSDIESMTVLKDASSTSIYGSRAANGIINIVTRKGKGKPRFDVNMITGVSSRAVKEYETVDERQYYELTWLAYRNDAKVDPSLLATQQVATVEDYATKLTLNNLRYNPFDIAQPFDANGKILSNAKLRWSESWMDEMIHNGIRQDINASISGADAEDKTNYFIGGGYLKDEGIVKKSNFIRYTGRVNLSSKITDWFEVGANSTFAKSDQNYPSQGTAYASDAMYFARGIAPIYPVHLVDFTTGEFIKDANGNLIYDFGNNTAVLGELRDSRYRRTFGEGQNVAATADLNPISNSRTTATGLAYANIKFHRTLSFKTLYNMNYNSVQQDQFWNPFYGDGTTTNGYSYRGITNLLTQNFTNTLTYDNHFNDVHHLNIVGGMESYKYKAQFLSGERTGYTFSNPTELDYGTTQSSNGNTNENRLESYFARMSYDYGEKYHFTGSLRRDGSTRFHKDHRWGTFYAVGASWNIDQEDFLKDVTYLSMLKPKISYGTSGNQALPGSFPYLGTYSAGANVGPASGSIINTLSNPLLSWEKTSQLDVGIDYGFLNDRITGSFTYFDRRSNNLLFERPMPTSSGVGSIADNVGGVKNHGFEFDISTTNIKRADFTWSTSFNITKLNNTITEAAPGTQQVVGNSWYNYYIRDFIGVDPADGAAMWYKDDANGNKVSTKNYNEATYYHMGNRLQDFTGGLSSMLKYKNIDFSILASFGIGGDYYDSNYQSLMNGIRGLGGNASVDVAKSWMDEGNKGDGNTPLLITQQNYGNSSSTRFFYDHTFVRVRNITVGYNFSPTLMEKAKLRSARIYFSAQNPFTFFPDAPRGADPDAGLNAQASNNNTTANKFISFGINVGI